MDMAIEMMNWLPYLPDLNLIEIFRTMLRAKIVELYPDLLTIKDNKTTK